MAKSNTQIYVDRPGDVSDTVRGTHWDFLPAAHGDRLVVYGIRRGAVEQVAAYPAGGYLGVQFANHIAYVRWRDGA